MSQYYVEVMVMRGQDWTSRGFHRSGSGLHGDPLMIDGQASALRMTLDFARKRAELYRNSGHRARVIDTNGNVVVDWLQPLAEKQQPIDRFNQHKLHIHRGLFILEDRATGRFHHRFAWPEEGGPERSVSGSSCEDVVQRLMGMPGDVPAYLASVLDKEPAPAQATPAAVTPQPSVQVALPAGFESCGFRPGSIR